MMISHKDTIKVLFPTTVYYDNLQTLSLSSMKMIDDQISWISQGLS